MRTVIRATLLAAAVALAAGSAWAQQKPGEKLPPPGDPNVKPAVGPADQGEPGVGRLEIWNGPVRTVHYVYRGLSPSEAQAVRELERAENEMTLANDMLALRMQYVGGERVADAQRRFTQQQLYGYSASESNSGSVAYSRRVGEYGRIAPWWGGWGWGGWGGGWSNGTTGAASGGFTSTDAVGLGQGVGDEGAIKTLMARTIAGQATPEYAARANADLQAAAGAAASYPVVRNSLGLKETPFSFVGAEVSVEVAGGGAPIKGTLMGEDRDYLFIKKADGSTSRVPKGNVREVVTPKSDKP